MAALLLAIFALKTELEIRPLKLPVYDFEDWRLQNTYGGRFQIGTPQQTFDFIIDIDESWSWVAFDGCTGCPTEEYF